MARFQIPGGAPIESICLDNTPKPDGKQRRLSLQYTGRSELGTGGLFLQVESHIMSQRLTAFTAEAKAGASGKAFVYPKTGDAERMLAVQVGKVTNHDNFTVDLFAELLGRSENPRKLRAYQRALDPVNNTIPDDKDRWNGALADQPLKQITFPAPANEWNCGGALAQFGSSFFGHYSSGSRHSTTILRRAEAGTISCGR